MRKVWHIILFSCSLQGCMEPMQTIDVYKLEKYNGSEVPVCINYQQKVNIVKPGWYDVDSCGNEIYIPAEYEPVKNTCSVTKTRVVSYDYCLERLPMPIHLVEKKENDITICYDRNNKVELPISYCQKDNVQIMNIY